MANCPSCGTYVNNQGQFCGSCERSKRDQEELVRMQLKESKMRRKEQNRSNKQNGVKSMHWKYFLICGWIFGLFAVCLIFPFFIKGLVSRAFGYW